MVQKSLNSLIVFNLLFTKLIEIPVPDYFHQYVLMKELKTIDKFSGSCKIGLLLLHTWINIIFLVIVLIIYPTNYSNINL